MKLKQTPIASAVALALMGMTMQAQAQQSTDKATQIEKVEVKGIRASLERSLETKRAADSLVEVITAEDIGKMPDKNVADSLQRVPGVTTSSQSGGSGGFDENDRVSMRGTNPSLTQTLINGHAVASADWFVLDQVGLVGRSVSFSMLPSELVGQVIVRKSATADLTEGGVAGAVDILTRKPLSFKNNLTLEGTLMGVYAERPDKWDPQINALVNWKNEAGNVGVLLQGFSEKRSLRRDGQEILGYGQISPTSALAIARPDLANVYYPTLIGSSFFEQERERTGGMLDVQVKINNDLEVDFSAFTSKLEASNYNRNWMFWGNRVIGGDNRVPTSYRVQNGTLVEAAWANAGTPGNNVAYAVVDEIYRPGAFSETNFYNFDVKWRASDRLMITGKVGTSEGKGETPVQHVFEGDVFNTGAAYRLNGISNGADVSFPSGNPSSFTGTSLDWIFGASPASTKDKEKYAQGDAEYGFDGGMFKNVKAGYRWAEHTRETHQVAQGPKWSADPFAAANLPRWNGETYPGDFADGIGGNFPRQPWMLNPGELARWGDLYSNRDPLERQYWPGEFSMKEKNQAVYVMTDFEGKGWSGNVGLRFVRTEEKVTVNVGIPELPGGICAPTSSNCPVPGAITTSAFGSFYRKDIKHTYDDVLPSLNLRFDIDKDLIGRLAATRTLARPDYSALGGSITADDTTHTGNGGNPDLKPIISNNFDATLEWYYAPRALLSGGLFYMDLDNYVGFGTYQTTLLNIRNGAFETYTIAAPVNSKGKVKGAELSWQQPFGYGFGATANYTYADGKENGGHDLVGTSKNTYNLIGYFENSKFGARLAYNFRSAYFVGLDRATPQYQDDTKTLSANLSYYFNDNLTFTFDAMNLNDPILKMYGANKDQPRAFYQNGRQYYVGIRMKM
ncbi:TonB-dependent receptor [Usitatibacter palustris]|uniref:Vitamin B12 transporter BtuB n=1 Tax=Usitatibacter palustris TaxID=2732487 RepID=A0A6M4HAB3_9PROT|nr:TonB-dependent receptor [Usitatibacter palustris]QJR16739.1 Vitamin B12 transporter BtuB [Usitatibacter palustris]